MAIKEIVRLNGKVVYEVRTYYEGNRKFEGTFDWAEAEAIENRYQAWRRENSPGMSEVIGITLEFIKSERLADRSVYTAPAFLAKRTPIGCNAVQRKVILNADRSIRTGWQLATLKLAEIDGEPREPWWVDACPPLEQWHRLRTWYEKQGRCVPDSTMGKLWMGTP